MEKDFKYIGMGVGSRFFLKAGNWLCRASIVSGGPGTIATKEIVSRQTGEQYTRGKR